MCYLDSFIDVIHIVCREVKASLLTSFLSDSCARCSSLVFLQEDGAVQQVCYTEVANMNIAVYLSELFASCGKLPVLGAARFNLLQ